MAKVGGTLTATVNAEVLAADATRHFLEITNPTASDVIYVEFGAAASTTATDDSIPITGGQVRRFLSNDTPEIKKSVNLRSTANAQYHVWDAQR